MPAVRTARFSTRDLTAMYPTSALKDYAGTVAVSG